MIIIVSNPISSQEGRNLSELLQYLVITHDI